MAAADVAVLYADPRGPYPKMEGVDWYDEARNAEMFPGGMPVVAHPPCGPWGRLYKFCTQQDPTDAIQAVHLVRECGGVLEHPAHSRLWQAMGLPLPFTEGDEWGFTLQVDQCAWGHEARKSTWLYCCGIDRALAVSGVKTGGEPTRVISTTRRKREDGQALPEFTVKWMRAITPPEFAAWLVELARSVKR